MPGSASEGKDVISLWLEEIDPTYLKILDIGVGKGVMSDYFKEHPNLSECSWTGVEIWEPYGTLEEFDLESKYDELLIGDAREMEFEPERYDLAICGNVLEHMTKEEAEKLIKKLQKCCKYVIISLVVQVYIRSSEIDMGENPYEYHVKKDWTYETALESFEGILDSKGGRRNAIFKLRGLE